jgi:ankyrin repeat protein
VTVAAHDLHVLLRHLNSGEETESESSDDQAVQSRLQPRYLPFSWAYCESAIANDEELRKLWETLGVRLVVCPSTTEPTPQEARDKVIGECGMGLGLDATPSNVPVATLRHFCMEYGAVDHVLLREEDQPTEGDEHRSEEPSVPGQMEDMLEACRNCTKTSVEVNLDDVGGASLLQLFGALLIRARKGTLQKLTLCGVDRQDPFFRDWSAIVSTLFSEDVFELVFEEDMFADEDIHMFGEHFNQDYRNNNSVPCKLAWSGNTRLMSQMFSKLPMESKVHADTSGLHDEDNQGEFGALHCAAYKGNVAMATLLLDKGVQIDEHCFDGATPLHVAVAQGNTDMVSLLLERKANVNNQKVRDPGWQNNMPILAGFTPLHTAVNYGCTDTLRLLLKAKAHTESLSGPISLCEPNRFPFSKSCFVDITEYDHKGHRFAPLHLAVQLSSATLMVELLLEHGAQVDARVVEGPTHTDGESYGDQEMSVHPLVSDNRWGPKPSEFDLALSTPLHLSKHPDSTSMLLAKGACLLAQDFNGQAAGLANGAAAVLPWLRRLFASEGRFISLICRRKQVPKAVTTVIFSFLVELHMADHVQQAMAQELSPTKWPIIAFSLAKNELWPIHGTTIRNAILEVNNRGEGRQRRWRLEDEEKEAPPALPELTAHPDLAAIVRGRLLEHKRSQLLAILDVAKAAGAVASKIFSEPVCS